MRSAFGSHHPVIETSAWLAPTAEVIGQVRLAEDVSVWFGAVLRGDNEAISVGRGSNLQDGVVVHVDAGFPCQVGEYCVVGHRAVLHGCRLGNEVLVGIGAIVLNGAVIPDGCLIGAGALVPENKQLDPNSLYVGVPVRKVRELSDEERARIRNNALGYIARAEAYAASYARLDEAPSTP